MSLYSNYISMTSLGQHGFDLTSKDHINLLTQVQTLENEKNLQDVNAEVKALLEEYSPFKVKNDYQSHGELNKYMETCLYGTSVTQLNLADLDHLDLIEQVKNVASERWGDDAKAPAVYGFLKTYL